MSSNKTGRLRIEPQIIKQGRISQLHIAQLQKKSYFAKVFNQQIIEQYNLEQTFDWNTQTLNIENNFTYPDNFLFIQATIQQGSAIGFLTNKYQMRLDQYIKKSGPQKQRQALSIFQDVLKAVYSLQMAGYYTKNLRPQHFVKCDKIWKLQSVIDTTDINRKYGLECQYTYNPQYKPPQAYLQIEFSEEQLQQRIVWDLGCMLIFLLAGGHKLRNRNQLEKFKDEPFSFKKIGLTIQDKLSSSIKQILGKMCHYKMKQRLKLNQLISKQFFSKEISKHYAVYKQLKNKKVNPTQNSMRSSTRSYRSVQNNLKVIGASIIAEHLKQSQRKQDLRMSNGQTKINSKIQTNQKFMQKIQTIAQADQISQKSKFDTKVFKNNHPSDKQINRKVIQFQQIQSKQNEIIDLYKNYLDKGQILGIGAQKFNKMLQLIENKQKGMELIQITAFAVNFVKCMDLCTLANSINQNKTFFQIQQIKWQKFHGSSEYYALKKLINVRRKQSQKNIQFLRKKIISSKNSYLNMHASVNKFIRQANPEQSKFENIKQAYRRILKLSYDIISNYYTNNKNQEWARLGMYIIYCLAIDKLYIPQKFQNNFKHFFKWSSKQPTNYISLIQFQQYLDFAPKLSLIENARFIIEEFYEIKKK